MPCFLCTGAILQFGIPKVIVGESVNFAGGACCDARAIQLLQGCGVEVNDLHDQECVDIMSAFIREKPDLWREDLGA